MKKIPFKLNLSAILLFFLFFLSGSIYAQVSDNPSFQQQTIQSNAEEGDPGDPYCDPLCNCRKDGSICPIDSNLYILLFFGILYGIKKVRDQKKIIPADINNG